MKLRTFLEVYINGIGLMRSTIYVSCPAISFLFLRLKIHVLLKQNEYDMRFVSLQSIILPILQHQIKDMPFLVKTLNFSWKGKTLRKGHS